MYLIIFGISLLFAMQTSSIYNNFTYLSYTNHLRYWYIIWVFILATFLLYKILLLYKKYSLSSKKDYLLIFTSYFSMIIGALLPYHPEITDVFSSLHIGLSSLGSILLLVIIKVLIRHLYLFSFDKAQKIDIYFTWFLSSFAMFAILLGSITIIVEEYFIFIVLLHLYFIEKIDK